MTAVSSVVGHTESIRHSGSSALCWTSRKHAIVLFVEPDGHVCFSVLGSEGVTGRVVNALVADPVTGLSH